MDNMTVACANGNHDGCGGRVRHGLGPITMCSCRCHSTFDASAWLKWWDENPDLSDPNTHMALMVMFGQMRDSVARG